MWPFTRKEKTLQSVTNGGFGFGFIRDSFAGAWQQNREINLTNVRDFFAIYACQTLISADISKISVNVKAKDGDGVPVVINNAILQRPNEFQNSTQFRQWWITSKLIAGNTFVLKQRDARGKITALTILDPGKVLPLVAEDGSVYYRLGQDFLAKLKETDLIIPASEIIHDRYQPQTHPLVGVSPIFSAALAGALGKKIQEDAHYFFQNGASMSGILTAPGAISKDTATLLSDRFNAGYSGEKAGRVAVVGDGLKFEPMRAKGVDSQIVEQLKLTAEVVASCYHVPPFKIGMADSPAKQQEANLIYYADCLQVLIEEMETCLTQGLELPAQQYVELEIEDLMRMDSSAIYETLTKAISGSISTPNEARKRVGLAPLVGGDAIYMQQQNYSLEALAKRDAQADPFGTNPTLPIVQESDETKAAIEALNKEFSYAI